MNTLEWKSSTATNDMFNVYTKTDDIIELKFDSMSDMVAQHEAIPHQWHSFSHKTIYSRSDQLDWYGMALDEVRNSARAGYNEALTNRTMRKVAAIEIPDMGSQVQMKKRRKRKQSDFGSEVDIHAVRQGRSDRAWTRTHQVHTRETRRVHLLVNVTASACVGAEEQLWRSAVCIATYRALVSAGVNVAVTAMYCTTGTFAISRNHIGIVSVPVKGYNDPMNEEELAFAISPAFWRHYMMEYGCFTGPYQPTCGKGHPIDSYTIMPYDVDADQKNNGHVVVIGQCFTESSAKQVVRNVVNQALGIDPVEQDGRMVHEAMGR